MDTGKEHDQLCEAALAGFRAGLRKIPPEDEELLKALGYHPPYERLGEGGYGTVYAVQQFNPRRTVAVKLLDESSREKAAFLREAVMGRLNHPGIATLHVADPGDGKTIPHLVMELVAEKTQKTKDGGVSQPWQAWKITEFAGRGTTAQGRTTDCVSLLVRLLEAVEFFHNQGGMWHIVHRDLKPSNILVDFWTSPDKPQPKILDFGIALLFEGADQPIGDAQHTGQTGSPPYQSPTDHGTTLPQAYQWDIYSLGVIAFEVLTGRHFTPGEVDHSNTSLDRELGFIVRKALQQGYESAADFKLDLQRFLENQPLPGYVGGLACDFSGHAPRGFRQFLFQAVGPVARRLGRASYTLFKFYRRNPARSIWGLAALLALMVGTVTSARLWIRAASRATELRWKSDELRLISIDLDRLNKIVQRHPQALLDIVTELEEDSPGQHPLIHDQALAGYWQVARSISNRVPEASAAVMITLGRVYDRSGRSKDALGPLVEGVALYRATAKRGDYEKLAEGLNWLSWVCAHQQPPLAEDAVHAAQECFELRKAVQGPQHDETIAALADLSAMLRLKGDTQLADDMFLDALALARGRQGTPEDRKKTRRELETAVLLTALSPQAGIAALDKFLEPFIDPQRSRLHDRAPWSLAQFGKHIFEDPKGSKAAGIAIANHAVELGKRLLGPDAPDVRRCEQLRDELKAR
jgi:serine/threonine protein kinase